MVKKIRRDPRDPCVCGSGKPLESCHLDWDGKLRKPLPSLQPPGSQTGYSHPSCYLRATGDCSEDISREHYMSKAILDQLGSKIRVSGVAWRPQGGAFETSVASLTAKILCSRHNEALSPLDQEAARFFAALRDAMIDLDRRTLSRKPTIHLIGDDTLELWMLKAACGVYHSVGSANGQRVSATHSFNYAKAQSALFNGEWDQRAGLYFLGNVGSTVTASNAVEFATLTDEARHAFAGVRVSFSGFTFDVIFDDVGTPPLPWSDVIRRPSEVTITKDRRSHYLLLTWPPGTPERSINLVRGVPSPSRVD